MKDKRVRKSILSLIVSLLLAFTMIPYNAFATTANEKDEQVLSYSWINPAYEGTISEADLTSEEPVSTFATRGTTYATTPEEAAEVVKEQFINRVGSFVLYYKYPEADAKGSSWFSNLCDEIFEEVWMHTGVGIEGDYMRHTFGGYKIPQFNYSIQEGYCYLAIPLNITYYTTFEQEEALTIEVEELLGNLVDDTMSDYEKITAIYDYMTHNIEYDYDNLNNNAYKLKYTAYAALVNEKAVCQGYANLFYRLALESGVDARIITGDAGGPHAWNIVRLANRYYCLDSTWDASAVQAGLPYKYFLLPSLEEHTNDIEFTKAEFVSKYPMAVSKYDPNEVVTECGHYETAALGEKVPATMTEDGLTSGVKCAACNETLEPQQIIPKVSTIKLSTATYTYSGYIKKPKVVIVDSSGQALSEDNYSVYIPNGRKNAGKYIYKVTFKNDYEGTKNLTMTINPAKLTSASLSTTLYTYNGYTKKPTVTAKAGSLVAASKRTTDSSNVDLTYASGRKSVGSYKVIVKGIGNYTGTITKSFKIKPAGKSIYSLTAANKAFIVKWTKPSLSYRKQMSGYEIRYSRSSKMTSAKAIKVPSTLATSKKISKLSSKRYYYVQLRTYKMVNGTKYVSSWSKVKSVKTK